MNLDFKKLKGTYSGSITMVGNGPSLDVSLIDGASMAMNSIGLLFDKTDWRPDLYVNTSRELAKNEVNHKRIAQVVDTGIPCFLTIELGPYIDWVENIYFVSVAPVRLRKPVIEDWSQDGVWVFSAATTMMESAQIAQYLGFAELKFVGMDGYTQCDSGDPDPNHFDKTYNQEMVSWGIDDPDIVNRRQRHAYAHIRAMFTNGGLEYLERDT